MTPADIPGGTLRVEPGCNGAGGPSANQEARWGHTTADYAATTTGTAGVQAMAPAPTGGAGAPVVNRHYLQPHPQDWQTDGWPHQRDAHGTCADCGATRWEYHYQLGPRCSCSTDPYNCPQGQALAQAILARKKALEDAHVRPA